MDRVIDLDFVRIAAIADLHVRTRDDLTRLGDALANLESEADILLMAGDLTENGLVTEMQVLADQLAPLTIPTFAIFGNHDRRGMRRRTLSRILKNAGVHVLDSSGSIVTLTDGHTLAIAGIIGTGGGFREGEQFGPGARFTKAVNIKSRREAARLRKVLTELAANAPDQTVVLTHFSPTASTLGNEPPLKHWMLGNALLGRTIDEFAPALVIHGHSHLGNEQGSTEGGIPVWNVASQVVGGVVLLHLHRDGQVERIGVRPIFLEPAVASVRESDMQ